VYYSPPQAMRTAVIYDVHGNLPALEAVLEEVRRLDVAQVIIGGDVVVGPMQRECLGALRSLALPVNYISGNSERVVLANRRGEEPSEVPPAYRDVIYWSAQQLAQDEAAWLSLWPETLRQRIDGIGDVLFCHATPRNDWEIFTRDTPEEQLLPVFDGANANLVVCGHTHMQFDRRIGATRVVNAGSVGMPFGEPGADWLLFGAEIELRHTTYDLARAAERIRNTNYPQAADFAESNVLHPPAEEAMLNAFTPASLKPRPSY
jgi:predicted phosphodiesterase